MKLQTLNHDDTVCQIAPSPRCCLSYRRKARNPSDTRCFSDAHQQPLLWSYSSFRFGTIISFGHNDQSGRVPTPSYADRWTMLADVLFPSEQLFSPGEPSLPDGRGPDASRSGPPSLSACFSTVHFASIGRLCSSNLGHAVLYLMSATQPRSRKRLCGRHQTREMSSGSI